MKEWFDTKFGKTPYKDVLLINFEINNNLEQNDFAFLQYTLLLEADVIQAHLEPSTKKGIAILTPNINPEIILKKAGIKYRIENKEIIPYEKVLKSNNMFIHE